MALQIGIVGGGQLARMMIAPAVEMGIDVRVLAEQPGMSAGLAATAVGDYRDLDTVLAFARDVDVITFDHEHVPQDVLRGLVEAGVAVRPGPDALAFAQDKIDMRTKLAELGLPQPEWAAVTDAASLDAFIAEHGGRAVVKTPRGGYDGKGVRVVSSSGDVADWIGGLESGAALLAEELVPFTRELAQQVARRPSGDLVVYPVVETVQQGGVCAEAIAPAPSSAGRLAGVAAEIGEAIATGLGVTGMLAVELFQTGDERLLVNELAMRPHNSGHWTQDGAITSQFEQHLRAVLDLPLGDTALRAPHAVMVNILGGPSEGTLADRLPAALEAHPSAKVHTYGKDPRPGRKVGHVNVAGDDLDDIVYQARAAAAFFLD
ncbi:5-(carboxyamino)imidazole ribonucleotide synthase [Microbacterium sp. NPDC091382]|uniref:5-(carboxyamino)imidazole ribonucleotide synthase n=1 Tax=Microbacterium sp. NPDC091382 TaxID=3364210 RepID=UPI00380A892E